MNPLYTKTEEKKTEVTEKPVTVLITVDEALKIAQSTTKRHSRK